MRGFRAIGVGAARRSHAQANVIDAGYPGEFSALDSPRRKPGMTRAAMLAALIVGTAMKFYREDLRKLYAADDHLAEAASAGPR
jgi:hypothetical protein